MYASDRAREENALIEVRYNNNYIADVDIQTYDLLWNAFMQLFALLGSFITFIVIMVQEDNEDFTTKAMNFPFTLTFLGDGLYTYLVIFLIIIF